MKSHWYLVCYTSGSIQGSCTIGMSSKALPYQVITKNLDNAAKNNGVDILVPVSVSYLGEMTKEEFYGE